MVFNTGDGIYLTEKVRIQVDIKTLVAGAI